MNIDEVYFPWLYSLVSDPHKHYWKLCEQLYQKEFVWFIPNDNNRNEEGIELRIEFLNETGIANPGRPWMQMSSSIFELLIALARRMNFIDDTPVDFWFWQLVSNLGLDFADDHEYNTIVAMEVDEILDRFIWRQYNRDGTGGLYPLRDHEQDQRRVEIYYQMSYYMVEFMGL